jgi:hypothetical protein
MNEPGTSERRADPVDHTPGEQASGQASPGTAGSTPPPEDLGDGDGEWVPV